MPSSFVSPQQVIKLVFNEPLLDVVIPDVEYSTRLSLCNEFGLFSRTLMPTDGTRITLTVAVQLLHHDDKYSRCSKITIVPTGSVYLGENGKVGQL
jgi:hypothetical protein